MTDTNNTDGAALLPVTPEDRKAAQDWWQQHMGLEPSEPLATAFARHRISHSLPGETVRSEILWQLEVCADNYKRDGKEIEARNTRWHMAWIKNANFDAALTPSALSGDNSHSSSNAGGVDGYQNQNSMQADAASMREMMRQTDALNSEVLASLSTPTAEPKCAMCLGGKVVDGETCSRCGGLGYRLTTPPTPDSIGKDAVREAIKRALKCEPRIAYGPDGEVDAHIVYDGGDPWEILRAALSSPLPATQEDAERSGVGERDEFLTAYVSEDARVIGIEHDTDADWQKVHDAHVALRDRLNERIAERDRCPRKPALSAPQRQEYDGEALTGLEWTDDGYSLRTPYDGDVDGDGRHVVVGGEVVVTFSDSEVGDEYRERILAALAHPAQATPSGVSHRKIEGDFLGMFDGPLGVVNRPTQKYRKTALITATQWFKDGDHPAVRMSDDIREAMEAGHALPWIETLEGGYVVTPGDWIATGVHGEHWAIKPDIFAATYEPVPSAVSGDAGEGKGDGLSAELCERITEYLCAGGLVNPELMDHKVVRDLLIDIREALRAEHRAALSSHQGAGEAKQGDSNEKDG